MQCHLYNIQSQLDVTATAGFVHFIDVVTAQTDVHENFRNRLVDVDEV